MASSTVESPALISMRAAVETIHLLLVEDNEDDALLTGRAFRSVPQITIDAVTRGGDAIAMAAAGNYHIAVVDYSLPDVSGMDVLSNLVAHDIPVIMVTGRGDEKTAVQALKSGAVDYLVKDEGYLRRLPQAVVVAIERNRLTKENRKLAAQTAAQAGLLSAVLELDPGAIAVFRGPDLRFELANSSFTILMQSGHVADLVGKPLDQIFHEYSVSHLREAIRGVYNNGEQFHSQDEAFPTTDGSNRYFVFHMMPLPEDPASGERGVVVIMWETTEAVEARLRIEKLAAQAEAERAWLQAVLDQMPEGVHIASAPGAELVLVNRAAEEIVGALSTVTNLSSSDLPQVFGLRNTDGSTVEVGDLPLQQALWNGDIAIGRELQHVRDDGTVVDLLVNAAPLHDTDGRIIAGVAIFQDITRLKDLDRLKDEFMSIASHELRTPLTNMRAAAQLVLKRVNQGTFTNREVALVSTIVQQSERMARLIEELLDVSRLQIGRFELRPERFDMAALALEVTNNSRLAHPKLTYELSASNPVFVEADRDRMAQVIGNLLENAIKYSPEGGIVALSVAALHEDGMARIEVRDSGIGFDPRKREEIFERFSRLVHVSNHSKGLGLGLFISRQIVTAHGGTITAYSSGPEQGATFTVMLPLAE